VSAGTVIIIISNPPPKRQQVQKMGPIQVEVQADEGETSSDLLRKAAALLEDQDDG